MLERREFLKGTLGALATFALGLPAARLLAAEPASALAASQIGPGLHLVDGWILTTADLRAIAAHEV
ncbi:hypothetical protein [Amaricoccus solimangrovi]|uniref:Twin-arginine translocation signal domain-containing protein n=1 Tax=Amaricoccus solimangrovi TaxID=2589815 RepID=A0A501WXS5_9RHOB|nr:hypothetical protein [Amaricoccus solimangrovi]TPE52984.1 hypothetical protein FJM51_02855 [Amaricoccus solimangrovi]